MVQGFRRDARGKIDQESGAKVEAGRGFRRLSALPDSATRPVVPSAPFSPAGTGAKSPAPPTTFFGAGGTTPGRGHVLKGSSRLSRKVTRFRRNHRRERPRHE